jgi:hypothetical protein
LFYKDFMSAAIKKPSFTENFPESAAFIALARQVFGADVERQYVNEGGRELGRPLDESRYRVITGRDLMVATPKEEAHGR